MNFKIKKGVKMKSSSFLMSYFLGFQERDKCEIKLDTSLPHWFSWLMDQLNLSSFKL